jgi:hypothetical protein
MSEVSQLPGVDNSEVIESSPNMISESGSISEEQSSEEQKLSKRDFEIAMRKYHKERVEKLKENKRVVDEAELEARYWKAQADLLRYRFEKMDFYIKNLELEPIYLQRVEEQRIKEEQASKPESPILS